MKVGDLVKGRHRFGVIATIMDKDVNFPVAKVMWSDGIFDWHPVVELEALNESR